MCAADSPISARQRVEAELKIHAARRQSTPTETAELAPASEKATTSSKLKEALAENARLKHRLAQSDGSLFDLQHDSADTIANRRHRLDAQGDGHRQEADRRGQAQGRQAGRLREV